MGWFFGRKSSPAPESCAYFPPAWLTAGRDEAGFARSIEGLTVFDKSSGQFATFVGGSWETGNLRGQAVLVDAEQVVGPRLTAVADPTGGTIIDAEARTAIVAILARLRTHGLIDS